MRLNFSISDADTIKEGVGRMGSVIEELVELYGTLTGTESAVRRAPSAAEARGQRPEAGGQRPEAGGQRPEGAGGQVLRMPKRRAGGS
jgi:hypothetical protein